MGLGLPLALLAAIAIVLPIAAHLARRRDLPRVDFPALALLERAKSESRQRLRVKDRGLLALRSLIVMLLASAAAAPFLWSAGAFGDGQVSSLAIVIDDSMSMQRGFDEARRRARRAIDTLPAGSEVALVAAGEPARILQPLSDDLDAARLVLAGMNESARGTDLIGSARLTSHVLASAEQIPRVLALSDFPEESESAAWPRGAELAFERIEPVRQNTAVVDATIAPNPTLPGTYSVRAVLIGPAGPLTVALSAGDDVLVEKTLSLSNEGRTSVLLAASLPDDVPSLRVIAQTPPDEAITLDDERVLLLGAATLRVLLIDGDPARQELRFVTRALDAAPRLPGGGRIRYQTIDIDRLPSTPLADFDVVLLANALASEDVLTRFVEEGGGLFVAGGDRIGRGSMRSLLPAHIGEPIAGQVGVSDELAGLTAMSATKRVALDPLEGANVLLRWSDRSPALVRNDRVAVFGSSLDDDWNDLPLQPGFVAFVHRTISSLGDARQLGGTYEAGAAIPLSAGTRIRGPSGESIVDGVYDQTGLPGLYTARTDDITSYFVVAAPPEESSFQPGALPSERRGEATTGLRSKQPIASWIFFLFGLFLIADGVLRTRARRAWTRHIKG